MRLPRVSLPGVLYSVHTSGDHGRNIFEDAKDYDHYIELLRKYKERYHFKLHAFSLLPSDIDLVLELEGDATISQILHALNSNYTKHFNARHGSQGHLFKERPKVVIAEKESYLLPLSLLIHQKPQRLEHALEAQFYPYSSCQFFANEKARSEKCFGISFDLEAQEIDEVMKQNGQGKNYLDHLRNLSDEQINEIEEQLQKEPILGSEEFIKKVRAAMDKAKQENQKQPKRNKYLLPVGAFGLVMMLAVSGTLYTRTISMKHQFQNEMEHQKSTLSERIMEEKERVYNDLDEKYRADRVSLMAAQKRIEIERSKNRELEEKLRS